MKHKPATPLPWHDCSFAWVRRVDGEPNAPQVNLPADSVFAAHACNNYHRLVNALRKLVEMEAEYGDPNNVAVNEAWDPASKLLYELGELVE